MARHHENILHWGNKQDGPDNYKDCRRGGSEDAFWDEDELVDYISAPSKKKARRRPCKKRGCPENNNKGHVYIWQEKVERYTAYYGDVHEYWHKEKICCGCLHVSNRVYPWSRRYKDIEV